MGTIEIKVGSEIDETNFKDLDKWDENVGTIILSLSSEGRLQHGWKFASIDYYSRNRGSVCES